MAFDWSTFVLEIINFLVLVWILKRFLYQPVLNVLAERRARIEQTLHDAQAKEGNAALLKNQYESRLAEWEQEKAAARSRLAAELESERQRQLELLNKELLIERERNSAQEAHRQAILQRELETQSSQQARQFASKLLARLVCPELEARLVELFIDEFNALADQQVTPLQLGLNGHGSGKVLSAYPLSTEQRKRIGTVIDDRLEIHSQLEFVQDPALLAGLRVSLGAWQLDLSLQGELSFYAEAADREQ